MPLLRKAVILFSTVAALVYANAASASIMLTFDVSNVQRNDCSGALQPTCSLSAAAGFTQRILFDGPLTFANDASIPGFQQTSASYGLPTLLDMTPYTAAMRNRLSGPVTDDYSGVQLDNFYDHDFNIGEGSALLLWDHVSDIIDRAGVRNQQEYKLGYNLLSSVVSTPNFYTDLVNESAATFLKRYGTLFSGSYDELGTLSSLDPTSLNFTSYAFTEYTGDVRLLDVANVPEPGSLALSLIAFAGLLFTSRRRVVRVSSLA